MVLSVAGGISHGMVSIEVPTEDGCFERVQGCCYGDGAIDMVDVVGCDDH